MKKLEIIHLRLAGDCRSKLVEEIRQSLGVARARIFRHATIDGDLSIHLLGEGDAHHSELGVRLSAALRDYGLVDHAIWLEETD